MAKMHAAVLETEGRKYLAVSLRISEGWHIYWKNPGDAGAPPEFSWKGEGGELPLEPLEWPVPYKHVAEGNILSFGHKDTTSFFYHFPPDIEQKFLSRRVVLHGQWLVCSNICIREEDSLTLTLKDGQLNSSPQHYSLSPRQLLQAFEQLPKEIPPPPGLKLYLSRSSKDKLTLHFSLERFLLRTGHGQDNVFYPFPQRLFDFKHEQLFQDETGKVFGKFPLDWNGEYLNPPVPIPEDGRFRPPLKLRFLFFDRQTGRRQIIQTSLAQFSLKEQEHFYRTLHPFGEEPTPAPSSSLLFYLLWAFLGGLILNFMPCVLPVVSLKLFSLIKSKQSSRRELLRHNIAYTGGILVSFLGLAGAVILLKSGGESVGWGFQLQSPLFVATMIVALLLFALNLFGLFEFRIPGNWLGEVSVREGLLGDFSSGILATILSTPCSAPFLGTALTFAFTSSATLIALVFLFIGLGLSTPFLLTAFFPRSLALLPRPGKWMDDLKKFLGLTLLLTIVWLYDVFLSLIDGNYGALILNLVLITLFFALYFHHRMGQKVWSKILFYLVPVFLFVTLLNDHNGHIQELSWKKWSEQAMAELQGKSVFINFTAQWCFTCKVNEKLVLKTSGFQRLIQDRQVELLLADWTKKDDAIASFLKRHGYVGVPAYFIQKPDGRLVSLGETITLEEIAQALDK